MNTDQYIKQFILQHKNDVIISSIPQWIYKHPAAVKTMEFAGMIFGAAGVCVLPLTFPLFRWKAVVLAAVGGIIAVLSFIAFKALNIVIPPHHNMQNHVFKQGSFGASQIYYQGDVPILELNSDDPYQAGLAHGYLLGPSLDQMLKKLNLIKWAAGMPHAAQVPATMQEIRDTLPLEYISELEGLVAGFNKWSKEHQWFGAKKVSLDDLILFHLMPDGLHFSPKHVEPSLKNSVGKNPIVGCTVVIDRDQNEGLTLGRNMDWPSFGIMGTNSLIINRKYTTSQKLSSVELGFPGFVGTLTGMNQKGVSLAMNVCSGNTDAVRGMPAAFFNRSCLENCKSLADVEDKINQESPLGSYHLSVADSTTAKSFHFYQGWGDGSHVTRDWQANNPLITTNCEYPTHLMEINHMHCSLERKKIIQELFDEAKNKVAPNQLNTTELVKASLTLPFVDNSITTHKIVMYPQSKKIQLAVDNAYAGGAQLHDLDTDSLF